MRRPGGWPILSLISTPEGAPLLCLRSWQTQGGDFDLPTPTTAPKCIKRVALRYPRPTVHFIHHIRAVSTITDSIPTSCENHSQIVAAKRVPASRGDQNAL